MSLVEVAKARCVRRSLHLVEHPSWTPLPRSPQTSSNPSKGVCSVIEIGGHMWLQSGSSIQQQHEIVAALAVGRQHETR
jgi:hypothetical protein